MDESPPILQSPDSPLGPSASSPPRVRRWRLRLAAGLLLLLAVAVFLPTLLGSPFGRPLLLAYVNQQLNGRVEIRECSLGWLSGMTINGLVIFDASDRQILQASRLTTGLRFLDLLHGRFRFREVRADELDLLLSRDVYGSLNWQHLIRSDSSWRIDPPKTPVSGELFLAHGSATYEDQTGQPPVFLHAINAYVNLHPAGGGVIAKLGATAQIGTQTSGQVLWDGSIRPVANGSPHVSEQLFTHGLDPAVVSQRLGPSWTLLAKSNQEAHLMMRPAATSPATAESQPGQTNDLVQVPPTR